MNKREAVAVQSLLDWVLNLAAFEHSQDVVPDVLPDEELIRVVGVLADRSHTALGAGVSQSDAIAAACRLVEIEPARPCPSVAGGDVPPNAGGAE